MKSRIILIEGLPGSGKTTPAKFLSGVMTEEGIDHQTHYEMSEDKPVKFIWPGESNFQEELIAQWKLISEDVIRNSSVLLMESLYWQWTTDFMVGAKFDPHDIINVNLALDEILRPASPALV
jgi:hypothetical protein